MSSSGHSSVSEWLAGLKQGNAESLTALWNRYFERLAELANRRMAGAPTRDVDGEDVAASAFESLWHGARIGRFDDVQDRHELWWLLVAITRRKVVSEVRKNQALKRGGGRNTFSLSNVHQETGLSFEQVLTHEPSAEDLVALDDELTRLLSLLRDQKSRRIAVLLMQGHSPSDISQETGLAMVSVRRKIRLVRATWLRESQE